MAQHGLELGPLSDGAVVAVIGGGPAGVATAIALETGARAAGRRLRVSIVEGRRIADEPGRRQTECAGVLSPPIVELVEQQLGVPFPHHLTRARITGYVLHTPRRQIVLDGAAAPSVALDRALFDRYMLDAARERGVDVVTARATGVEVHADRAVVYTERAPLRADVVVGAFGLDDSTAALFSRAVGYTPPPAMTSMATDYHPGAGAMAGFGDRVHAFLPRLRGVEFGAITPKADHLTVNIAGGGVDADAMNGFLSAAEVWEVLPSLAHAELQPTDLRFFRRSFPCGLARRFAGDRYVMVGDAAGLVRAFKGKGVTSAIQTGIRAAEVILRAGISAAAFETYHAANRDITDDLPYGRAVRRLTTAATRLGVMDAVVRAAEIDPGLRRALFDAVSAHRPYREVVGRMCSPRAVVAIARAIVLPRAAR